MKRIADLLTSKKAIKALASAGYTTTDDLVGVAQADLISIKGVGDVTLQRLQNALAPAPAIEPEIDEWEESDEPIHLDGPNDSLAIRITHADEIRDGKRVRVINPHFLEFENGHARLTKKLYLLAKYLGDKSAAREALMRNEPWRLDAIEWLRAKPSYRAGSFIILTD